MLNTGLSWCCRVTNEEFNVTRMLAITGDGVDER